MYLVPPVELISQSVVIWPKLKYVLAKQTSYPNSSQQTRHVILHDLAHYIPLSTMASRDVASTVCSALDDGACGWAGCDREVEDDSGGQPELHGVG